MSELLSAVIAFVSMTTVTGTYCWAPQLHSEESGSCLSCSQLLPLSDVEFTSLYHRYAPVFTGLDLITFTLN